MDITSTYTVSKLFFINILTLLAFSIVNPDDFSIPSIFLNSKITGNSLKFTLTWDNKPYDLDLHAKFQVSDSSICHVFFGKSICLGTSISSDIKNGGSKGSEYITISSLGNYKYMIYVGKFRGNGDDSNIPLQGSNASISLYSSDYDQPVFTITVPNTSVTDTSEEIESMVWWLVLCFDGSQGMKSLNRVNTLLNYEPDYKDCLIN